MGSQQLGIYGEKGKLCESENEGCLREVCCEEESVDVKLGSQGAREVGVILRLG